MNRVVSLASLAFGLLLFTPLVASAEQLIHQHTAECQHESSGTGVPELDPGAASAALSLLVGGALVLSGRRRQRG